MNRKTIKSRLRELLANPGQPGTRAEIQRLRGELLRERGRTGEEDVTEAPEAPVPAADGLTEAQQWAAADPELRARLQRSAFSRVIDRGSSVSDPDNWGAKNDLRRRGARP